MDDEPRNTRKTRKGFSGLYGINGGITVFETRFPRDSQKEESTEVPRTRWRSDIRNFSPSPPLFASCGPSCSNKSLKYSHGRRSLIRSFNLLHLFLFNPLPLALLLCVRSLSGVHPLLIFIFFLYAALRF